MLPHPSTPGLLSMVFFSDSRMKPCPYLASYQLTLVIVALTETILISKQNVTPLMICPICVFLAQLLTMPPIGCYKWSPSCRHLTTVNHNTCRQVARASLPYTAGLQWYWARTRDKASHDPMPIPLGYRGHPTVWKTLPPKHVKGKKISPDGQRSYTNHCPNCPTVQLSPQHILSYPAIRAGFFKIGPKDPEDLIFSGKAVEEVVFDSFAIFHDLHGRNCDIYLLGYISLSKADPTLTNTLINRDCTIEKISQLFDSSCKATYSHFGLAIHQNDHQARRRFVEWAQNEIAVVPDFHKRILFSDEAHFWLNGYVNKQNCCIWSEANPQVYVETPLHLEKLTVLCALCAGGIFGPYFFKNDEGHNVTVNGDRAVAGCRQSSTTLSEPKSLSKEEYGDCLVVLNRFDPPKLSKPG
ncbi:hypothetical protein TNCV_4689331 [Trichonephila clavipes]|nr:hypothetical protein TNCV_4689331 [Trichonephila clavipes]